MDQKHHVRQKVVGRPRVLVFSVNNKTGPTPTLVVKPKRRRYVRPRDTRKKGSKKDGKEEGDEDDSISRTQKHPPASSIRPGQLTVYSPSISSLDPFNTRNRTSDANFDYLLHNWTITMRYTRIPLTPRAEWLSVSIAHPTLMAVSMISSTSHILLSMGAPRISPLFLTQKMNAIRLINEDLKNPVIGTSDQVIMSVAAMVIIDCFSGGSPGSCSIHKRGLELLVQKRGTLEDLGLNGLVERTVSWADNCCAIYTQTKPSFHPFLVTDSGESVWSKSIASSDMKDLLTRLLPVTGSSDLSMKIVLIWARLQQLTTFLITTPFRENWKLDAYSWSEKLDALERQTLGVFYSVAIDTSPCPAFLKAFLNSVYIYIIQALREIPRGTSICRTVASRIHSGLELVDLRSFAPHCPDVLLWVIMVGRTGAAQDESVRHWFNETLKELLEDLEFTLPDHVGGLGYFDIAQQALSTVKNRKSQPG